MPTRKKRSEIISEIRRQLSDDEFQTHKEKLDRAERNLEDIKTLLANALFLHNGALSAARIDYAAFRVETLSLIFEVARKTFRSINFPATYDKFVADLGTEVGLTYARDLMERLDKKRLIEPLYDVRTLLELWASFENDTGAGVTTIEHYSEGQIIVRLKNNPLRRSESSPHCHCGFYTNYIASLINELNISRVRILEAQIDHTKVECQVITSIDEQKAVEDECVFVAKCRPARLTHSLSLMEKAFHAFYSIVGDSDYGACMHNARGALTSAQLETLEIDIHRELRQSFQVFRDYLPKEKYRLMNDTYQRVSSALHPEQKSKREMTKEYSWNLLCEIREVIYALELLSLSEEQVVTLKRQAELIDRTISLEELAKKADKFTDEEKQQFRVVLTEIRKGVEPSEEKQIKIINVIRKLGDKAWEIARPVLIEVLTDALKKQYGLD